MFVFTFIKNLSESLPPEADSFPRSKPNCRKSSVYFFSVVICFQELHSRYLIDSNFIALFSQFILKIIALYDTNPLEVIFVIIDSGQAVSGIAAAAIMNNVSPLLAMQTILGAEVGLLIVMNSFFF